ncbi:helix-turn-helix domain-containing protein [Rhodococcus wratislaviensis]|nr:helix-turn-helix domain-containing protein [Rhodococcus sp. 3A]MBC2894512.1 helix-turn-helix domain-containing protein [Rhodococcus sp. 4CII]
MLSLGALLADTALELTLLVRGAGDIDADEVLWLHNTELPDPAPYIRETELVLTNGLWQTSVTADAFVDSLVTARASGLVFGLTEQTPRVPPALVTACENARMSLLELSIAVPFTAITQAAAKIQSEARQDVLEGMIRRGNALAASLTRGAGAIGVLEILSKEYDLPLLVVDRAGSCLASLGDAADDVSDDQMRLAGRALGQHPPPLEVSLSGVGPAAVYLVEGAVGTVDAALLCLKPLAELEQNERAALDQAARFLSLEVAKKQALHAIESRFSGEVLEMILSGPARAAELPDRLRAFGIDPTGPLAILTIAVGAAATPPVGATEEIEQLFSNRGTPVIVAAGSNDIVTIFPWTSTGALADLAESLADTLTLRFALDRTVVGIGELARSASGLRDSLVRSREACHVLRRRSHGPRAATFADVGTHRMLLGLHDRTILRRFADDVLGPLRTVDARNGSELERTLRVFLRNDCHWSATATDLYVHVNTLRNRVARITELTGRDVNRIEDAVDLYLALEADGMG